MPLLGLRIFPLIFLAHRFVARAKSGKSGDGLRACQRAKAW